MKAQASASSFTVGQGQPRWWGDAFAEHLSAVALTWCKVILQETVGPHFFWGKGGEAFIMVLFAFLLYQAGCCRWSHVGRAAAGQSLFLGGECGGGGGGAGCPALRELRLPQLKGKKPAEPAGVPG